MISGNATQFDASASVDLGPGVTVSSARLVSPTPNPEPAGMFLWNQGMQDGVQELVALVDAFATPGPRPLSWSNPILGGHTFVADPATLSVGARSPVALAVPSTTSVAFDTRSKLFGVSTSQLGLLSVRASAIGSSLAPMGLLLPESGEVALVKDLQVMWQLPLAAITDGTTTTSYVVIGGNPSTGTGAGYTLTLDVSHTAVALVTAESSVAHDGSSPQPVTPPAIVSGALATGSEVDAYSVSVPAGATLEITMSSLTEYAVTVTLQPPPNEPSVRLHESLGLRKIGVYPRVGFKLGRWHDVGWWQLELRERIGPPAPVLSMDEASRAEGWRQALSAGLALPR